MHEPFKNDFSRNHKLFKWLYLCLCLSYRPIGARYNGTTWTVKFSLDNVESGATYKLRVAIASATNSDLEVQ